MQTASPAINDFSFTKKFIYRFCASYFFIYIFPFPLAYIQLTKTLNNWYNRFWSYLISFFGKHIFHIPFSLVATNNGSGDTTYNYMWLFLVVVLAIIAAILWSVIKRKQKRFDVILYWIMVYLRFYLAIMMMRYGLEKIIKTQFPFPYYSLNETYGASSPMRLLWTFMGYSKAFNVFTGLIEIAAGALLLFKKTATFGLLICITVLANVVVINFCFDVPVKLFAVNLLLMAIFLLAPDIKRVTDFFFRNKAVPAVNYQPIFSKWPINLAWLVIRFAVIVSVIYSITMFVWNKYNVSGDGAFKKTPLFGIYAVEKFVKNNDTLKISSVDTTQWKTLNIVFPKQAVIQMMNNDMKYYSVLTDTLNKKIELYENDNPINKSMLFYSLTDSTHLILNGKFKDDSVYIQLRRQSLNEFPLLNRKFHWVSEAPYNK
jgi:hypothetical protein